MDIPQLIAPVTADAEGSWQYEIPEPLGPGTHRVQITNAKGETAETLLHIEAPGKQEPVFVVQKEVEYVERAGGILPGGLLPWSFVALLLIVLLGLWGIRLARKAEKTSEESLRQRVLHVAMAVSAFTVFLAFVLGAFVKVSV